LSLRILIADDEELERRALRSILSGLEGHELELLEAANGRQALELAEGAPVDLAFLDIRMPGMDGLKAAHELKKLCPDIHVVFVTAFDQFDYAREALRLGVDEYLVKPASAAEVLDTARRVLARIEEKRLASAAGLRSGRHGEQALALLEEELRADLGSSAMDGGRLRSFFSLKGVESFCLLALVLRLGSGAKPDSAVRKLALKRVKDLAKLNFSAAGWHSILEEGDDELYGASALPIAGTEAANHITRSLHRLAEDAYASLGYRVLIGACYQKEGEGGYPFVSARDALALAKPDRPLALLAPGGAAGDDIGIDRHGGSTVERALSYMHAHLAEDISLADVAQAVGSAPSHLSRLFSRQGGDTFVRVFCRLRIAAAKDLLRSGQYRVKEVCAMVGFNDQAYFSRVFRRYEGVSPVDYRAG
jgi:two-component system response regulator YesN